MDQEPDEIGRFQPKGDPYREPREPFIPDEMLSPGHKPKTPSLKNLPLPSDPLTKEKIDQFLHALEPIFQDLPKMPRKDQHILASKLHEVKNKIHSGEFSDEIKHLFDKIADHLNRLLIHSHPVDQEELLKALRELRELL